MTISMLSSISGETNTLANDVWRALGLIERRDAHQAVDADLAVQQAEGVLAVDRERRALMPGFFAGLVVVEHGLEALPLGPAQVHAQQHLGPVLRLGAAGAGMDRDDGVAGVVLAGEQGFGLELVDEFAEGTDFATADRHRHFRLPCARSK